MQGDIIQQGMDLMLFGMGAVFIFLALLVAATTAMSNTVQRLIPASADAPMSPPQAIVSTAVNDPKLVAIIEDAVRQHRAKR